MYGRTFYDVWLEKYGKEEADRLLQLKKEKQSKLSSGKNNPMYGKAPGVGAGNGWQGWYKNQFFRSLRELMCLIYLDTNNISYHNGESKNYSVEYKTQDGKIKTYRPDFILEDKIIEVKPLKLQNTDVNKRKAKAIKKLAKRLNLKFEYIDPTIDFNVIKSCYHSGCIKFTHKYEERFQKEWLSS